MQDSNDPRVAFTNWQRALIEEGFGQARRFARIPGIWLKAQQVRKGCTPAEVVYEKDKLKLLHYLPTGPVRYRTPLVFVFALVNRPYILDLKPGRSVVSHFVEQGFDTYLVDWGTPGAGDRHRGFDDYVNGYLGDVLEFLEERTGSPTSSLLGYCMGGTLSTIYTALHPERVRNLMLLAAGIDFSTREGLLNLWTDPRYFDVDQFIGAHGNCPAEFLQGSFLMLKPVQNLIEKPINFFERAEDDRFIEDFLTMETWLNDNIPVAGQIFREFVKYLYQQNLLVQNKLRVGRRIVDLRNIRCPILNIAAQADDLVPCAQSLPLNDLVSSTDRRTILCPAGHIGLAVGGKAQKEVWPEACRWLAQRSEPVAATR